MKGRIHFHSIIKSIRGRVIFYTDVDRLLFLNILRRFTDKHSIEIVEYVLMDNHVHLLHTAQSYDHANMFIKEMQQNFSFWYNRLHGSHDKFFVPARIYPKYSQDSIIKTSMYILQNPMAACPGEYPHPEDYKWSSYHYHYDFMDKAQLLVNNSLNIIKANKYFDLINASRSIMVNKCPLLRSGFQFNMKLLDIIDVNHNELDSLYSKKEFKIVVQKSVVTPKEEYSTERLAKNASYIKKNKESMSQLSDFLGELLGEEKYIDMQSSRKEDLIFQLYTFTKATPLQISMLLDEDKNYIRALFKQFKYR
ncbi:MAG: transposase [Bacteroidales bacterium]|nr:transposase [Bacteroidales bacterium]MBQ8644895.1 transposase [Bacteroidales bacterium]